VVASGLLAILTVPQLRNIAGKREIDLKNVRGKPAILNAIDPHSENSSDMEVGDSEDDMDE
jgi:hypothetical protein